MLTGTGAINGTGNELDNVLGGNTGANVLTGAAGNDSLNGGAGNDTLIGGTGNDTYYVDAVGDVITEVGGEGTELVNSTSLNYTLGANVENLVLQGAGNINGTGNTQDNVLGGNAGANVLTGAAGNDSLNGGAGVDTLVGGTGHDTYYVDNASDVVTELIGEGTDLVYSTAASYTLSANVDKLTLAGTADISGAGNDLNNVIVGNAGANVLSGEAGDDYIDGAAGNDSLVGGLGNDTLLGSAGGQRLHDDLTMLAIG